MASIQQLFLFLFFANSFNLGICDGATDGDHTFKLKCGVAIPLIGMGIGNLAHQDIPHVANAQLGMGVQLVDTAHASNNERLLGEAIASSGRGYQKTRGGRPSGDDELAPIHVVTKVWYTHLGYERTKVSVKESLKDLESDNTRQIYVHMLLHWPRCHDDIEWMNCESEENNLPQSLREVGPAPHLNKESAFLESWKALEDIYIDHQPMASLSKSNDSKKVHPPIVVSIGVSNFELDDMKRLMEKPRISPHMYQGNVWAYFNDPYLMDFLREHNIFLQAYAVMNEVLAHGIQSPNAYSILSNVSRDLLTKVHSEGEDVVITEATVILAYFVHNSIGVIPRAASSSHQHENSPRTLSAILPHLTTKIIQQIELAIPALVNEEDVHTSVSFMNALESPIQVHWINPETGEEELVSNNIHPGSVEMQNSHPGHKFVAYDPDRTVRKEFLVDAAFGEVQHFMVEL